MFRRSKENAYKKELIDEFNRILKGGNETVNTAVRERNNVRVGTKKLDLNSDELNANPIFNDDGSLITQPTKKGDRVTIGNVHIETRFLKLEEQGLTDSIMSQFNPRLTQKQLLILEALIHETVGNVSTAKGRLGNDGELMMQYMKQLLPQLVTPENLSQIPEMRPSRFSGTINEFYANEEAFFKNINNFAELFFHKNQDGTYGTLKSNNEILKDPNNPASQLSNEDRQKLEQLLEPYRLLANMGNPFGRRNPDDSAAIAHVLDVISNNDIYRNAMIGCNLNYNNILPLIKNIRDIPQNKTGTKNEFMAKIDNILIMPAQRSPKISMFGEAIAKLSKESESKIIGERIKSTMDKFNSNIDQLLDQKINAIPNSKPLQAKDKQPLPPKLKIQKSGYAASAASTPESLIENDAKSVFDQSKASGSPASRQNQTYSSKKHPARVAYEKLKGVTASSRVTKDPDRKIDYSDAQKRAANRQKARAKAFDELNTPTTRPRKG